MLALWGYQMRLAPFPIETISLLQHKLTKAEQVEITFWK